MAKAATSRAKGKTTTSRAQKTTTRTRSTTTRKTSTSKADKAALIKPAEELKVVTEVTSDASDASDVSETADAPEAVDDALRKRDLIEAVVARSGVKKRDAKPAIEAALAILGETLQEGRGLNLPELGKMKIQNSKELEDATVVNLRLRRKFQTTSDVEEKSE